MYGQSVEGVRILRNSLNASPELGIVVRTREEADFNLLVVALYIKSPSACEVATKYGSAMRFQGNTDSITCTPVRPHDMRAHMTETRYVRTQSQASTIMAFTSLLFLQSCLFAVACKYFFPY